LSTGSRTSFASRSASSPERSVWSKTTTREAPETFLYQRLDLGVVDALQLVDIEEVVTRVL